MTTVATLFLRCMKDMMGLYVESTSTKCSLSLYLVVTMDLSRYGITGRASVCSLYKAIWTMCVQQNSITHFLGSTQQVMIKLFDSGTGKAELVWLSSPDICTMSCVLGSTQARRICLLRFHSTALSEFGISPDLEKKIATTPLKK